MILKPLIIQGNHIASGPGGALSMSTHPLAKLAMIEGLKLSLLLLLPVGAFRG